MKRRRGSKVERQIKGGWERAVREDEREVDKDKNTSLRKCFQAK